MEFNIKPHKGRRHMLQNAPMLNCIHTFLFLLFLIIKEIPNRLTPSKKAGMNGLTKKVQDSHAFYKMTKTDILLNDMPQTLKQLLKFLIFYND